MGRRKVGVEERAEALTISLRPEEKEKLRILKEYFGLRKNSSIVQLLIAREYDRSIKIKGA